MRVTNVTAVTGVTSVTAVTAVTGGYIWGVTAPKRVMMRVWRGGYSGYTWLQVPVADPG